MTHAFNPSLVRLRLEDLCKFVASMIYIVRFIARAVTKGNPLRVG